MVRVLVVDDSATARLGLRRVLEADPEVRVVGEAANGHRALQRLVELRPDLVTMDVHLGKEDGIELAGRVMTTRATPILVVTSADPHDRELAFRAVEAGALDVCAKPVALGAEDPARAKLVRLVKVLAGVPVVTRRRRAVSPAQERRAAARAVAGLEPSSAPPVPALRRTRLVAIGASTGGPPVLQAILRELPAPFPVPILVTQHISVGFVESLAAWLADTTGHQVAVCKERVALEPGRVYVACDHHHMRLVSRDEVAAVEGPPRGHLRPSVDELFESVAAFAGADATAILLTGMGRDGAAGMQRVRERGGNTIAQAPETCAVDGMPRAALDAGAAAWALPPPLIVGALARIGAAWAGAPAGFASPRALLEVEDRP